MSTEFIVKAVTPEGLVFEKNVTFLKVRTENGDIGIRAKHINFVTPLGAGEMLVRDAENNEKTYYLAGGFLEVRQDKVIILGEDMVESHLVEKVMRAKELAIERAKIQKIREEQDILGSKKKIQQNLQRK